MPKTIYHQMMETAINAGLAVLSKEKAAKLLAACFAYGDEPFALADRLHADTMIAARILGIQPGETAPQDSVKLLNQYFREIACSVGTVPAWLASLGAEYGVEFPPYRRE